MLGLGPFGPPSQPVVLALEGVDLAGEVGDFAAVGVAVGLKGFDAGAEAGVFGFEGGDGVAEGLEVGLLDGVTRARLAAHDLSI
jgi:hypothetical protein